MSNLPLWMGIGGVAHAIGCIDVIAVLMYIHGYEYSGHDMIFIAIGGWTGHVLSNWFIPWRLRRFRLGTLPALVMAGGSVGKAMIYIGYFHDNDDGTFNGTILIGLLLTIWCQIVSGAFIFCLVRVEHEKLFNQYIPVPPPPPPIPPIDMYWLGEARPKGKRTPTLSDYTLWDPHVMRSVEEYAYGPRTEPPIQIIVE